MYKSLDYLKEKYPFFLSKKDTSNFTRVKKVFNNRLQDISNDIFKVYLSGFLEKHILIWKVQEEPYNYDIYFHTALENIKNIQIIKKQIITSTQTVELDDGTLQELTSNEEIETEIYNETFNYEDNINKFEYLHSDTSESIIPLETYLFKVETWNEYTLVKGFPENDTFMDDEYDHDYSLDSFGVLYDVPRKNYKPVDPLYYPLTEPAYNNRLTEDDYHYMNRILYYINNLFSTPLPVLEIWKLFGLPLSDIKMINRERYIARMIDVTRHSTEDGYIWNWSPQRWEHKDRWCTGYDKELFFFANASNNTPISLQRFYFDFTVIDSLCRPQTNDAGVYYDVFNPHDDVNLLVESSEPFYILPFVNNVLVDIVLYSDKIWSLTPCPSEDTEDLIYIGDDGHYYLNNNTVDDFHFIFKCFRTIGELESEVQRANGQYLVFDDDWVSDEILISVRGCNTASWYVNSNSGDDNNTGTSKSDAFKSLDKALDLVEGEKNIISLADGKYNIQGTRSINVHTVILSCPGAVTTIYSPDNIFFSIVQDASLYLQNIGLKYNCCKAFLEDYHFINHNLSRTPLDVGVNIDDYSFQGGRPVSISPANCLTPTRLSLVLPDNVYYGESVMVSGVLCLRDSNSGLGGESLEVIIDGELVDTIVTDSDGSYSFDNVVFSDSDTHSILVRFNDTDSYNECSVSGTVKVEVSSVSLDVDYLSEAVLVDSLSESNSDYARVVQGYSLTDDEDSPVDRGSLELYEDNVLVETITAGEEFTYIPSGVGEFTYTVKYVPVIGFESVSSVFDCIVKYNPVSIGLSSGSLFMGDDTVIVTGDLVSLTGDTVTGEVSLTGDIESSLEVVDGSFSFNLGVLASGHYNININYSDTDSGLFGDSSFGFVLSVLNPYEIVYDDTQGNPDVLISDMGTGYLLDNAEYVIYPVNSFNDSDDKLVLLDSDDDTSLYTGENDIVIVDEDSDDVDLILTTNSETEDITGLLLETNDITAFYKHGDEFFARLTEDGNPLVDETVQFSMNGVNYNRRTDSDGYAKLNINHPVGEYYITSTYNDYVKINHVSIIPQYIIEAEDYIIDYPDTGLFTVRLIDNKTGEIVSGGTLKFNLEGNFSVIETDSEGYASLEISNLGLGEHIITIIYYEGNNELDTVYNTILVRDKYVLETHDLTKTYGDNTPFIIRLTDYDNNPLINKPVTFNLNGLNYTRETITDNTGYAKLNIFLPVGQWTITTTYETVTKNNIITIYEAN